MKRIITSVFGKMPQIMVYFSLAVATLNMNSTCYFLSYQPDIPEDKEV